MASEKGKMTTLSMLVMFLLSLAVFVTSALFLDMRHKNQLLLLEIERLQNSQVLLMVPDEQAEVVAKWMSEHPEATQALLSQAKPQQQVKVEVGPGVEAKVPASIARSAVQTVKEPVLSPLIGATDDAIADVTSNNVTSVNLNGTETGNIQGVSKPDGSSVAYDVVDSEQPTVVVTQAPKTLSKSRDGVKVISLPHGGIRVTTREEN